MCSVVEIVNSEEYNIYYQSPETCKEYQNNNLTPIYESEAEKDFSLEEFGSYHFIKESEEDVDISENQTKVSLAVTFDDIKKSKEVIKDDSEAHPEVRKKLSDGKRAVISEQQTVFILTFH